MVRISGLASGMDIDTLVSSMMNAARVPLDTITQKKTFTEWQRDDYRDINKSLLELDTLIFEGVGKQSSYIKKTVNISVPDAISVKNISSTSDFSGTISNPKLATAATMVSNGAITITSAKESLSTYKDQTISIEAIGKTGELEKFTYIIKDTDTLDSVISKMNSESGVTAFYDTTSKKISFTAKNTGDVSGAKPDMDLKKPMLLILRLFYPAPFLQLV